ncbi:MAG: hypothetical protein IM566_23335 [Pseudanabaena sp. M152S2SP2A07QC]|jgi:hypothetical protein|nr:hypothetical protein [Pseudanabaena sp. M125S2SP2A07QC]MCA6550223.1 hypothetical protein [Pseudanabaena sp. M152S2SP2A07QC]MCA6569569.1 hypothetical protein [Pseudanabaena sp. M065S1SP2A07QC]
MKKSTHYSILQKSLTFVLVVTSCCNLVLANKAYGEISVSQVNSDKFLLVQARSVISEDVDVIISLSGLPSQWNKAAAPFIRDYLDPNISSEQWVKEASFHIGKLRSIYLEMNALTLMLQDAGIRNIFEEFVDNYKAKLIAVTDLHFAVAHGDPTAEKQASQAISKAASKGNQLAQSFLQKLRPHIDNKTLIYELQKRGRSIDELMKPNR